MFRAVCGADADALLDALGVEQPPYGRLDLTPGVIDVARALRGEPRLQGGRRRMRPVPNLRRQVWEPAAAG